MDVSDAGGVFDLICEQLDGETLSAKGANLLGGRRKVFELTKIFQHRNGLGLLFSLETLQVFCFFFFGFFVGRLGSEMYEMVVVEGSLL